MTPEQMKENYGIEYVTEDAKDNPAKKLKYLNQVFCDVILT
jgi:hypothetical protein